MMQPNLSPQTTRLTRFHAVLCGVGFCLLMGMPHAGMASVVTLDGSDITQEAAPLDHGGTLLVNLSAVATRLGLRVQFNQDWTIIDASGTEWKARSGVPFLETTARHLLLHVPAMQQGVALYLPIEALSELAGAQLQLEADHQTAHLTIKQQTPVSEVGDWQGFTLEKPTDERPLPGIARSSSLSPASSLLRLPAAHDNLTFGLGLGYLRGANLGMELTGEGRYLGANVRFASLLHLNAGPPSVDSFQFSWEDPVGGRKAEFGNLYSNLWGGRSGLSYAWRAGKDHWPTLSLYMGTTSSFTAPPVLAFHDEVSIARTIRVGGEMATDGSLYFQTRFQNQRLSGAAYLRHLSGREEHSYGGLISYTVGRGVSLYADLSSVSAHHDRTSWNTMGLHVPLTHFLDLTLEQTRAQVNTTSSRSNAVMLSMPLGVMQLFIRYQQHQTLQAGVLPNDTPFEEHSSIQHSQELQTSAIYFANPHLRFELQGHSYAGLREHVERLTTAYRVFNRTQLQVTTTFPQALALGQWQIRVEHQLRKDLALAVEFGLPLTSNKGTSGTINQGMMLSLRTHWTTATPIRGGEIKGQVTDEAGLGVRNVVICLNDYRAQTDAQGNYLFQHVLAGDYDLSLLESSLPADCKAAQPPLHLTLKTGMHQHIPLKVLPLHTIMGRVYCDLNGNGKQDTGEAVSGITVSIGGAVTTTAKDGSFAFYNLEPGRYAIRLLTNLLPETLALDSLAEVLVDLPLDHSVSGIEFRLKPHTKDIIFQE